MYYIYVHLSLDIGFYQTIIYKIIQFILWFIVACLFTVTKEFISASGADVMTFNETDTQIVFVCYPLRPDSCLKVQRYVVVKVTMYAFLVLMILTTVFGNLLIIISISHFKQLQSPTHLIVRSLAASDCLLGSLVMPYSMVRSVEGCWYLGDVVCKVHSSLDMSFCISSLLHLCLQFFSVANKRLSNQLSHFQNSKHN